MFIINLTCVYVSDEYEKYSAYLSCDKFPSEKDRK